MVFFEPPPTARAYDQIIHNTLSPEVKGEPNKQTKNKPSRGHTVSLSRQLSCQACPSNPVRLRTLTGAQHMPNTEHPPEWHRKLLYTHRIVSTALLPGLRWNIKSQDSPTNTPHKPRSSREDSAIRCSWDRLRTHILPSAHTRCTCATTRCMTCAPGPPRTHCAMRRSTRGSAKLPGAARTRAMSVTPL